MPDTTFTSTQILFAIATWTLEPLTLKELNYLIRALFYEDDLDDQLHPILETWTYGENDIESLILHIISDSHE